MAILNGLFSKMVRYKVLLILPNSPKLLNKCEQNRQRAIKRWEERKNADDAAAFSAMHKKENEKEKEKH